MQRLLQIFALPLVTLFAACSSHGPADQHARVVDSFLASLNARDFDALYELHSAEFKEAISRKDATKRYKEFRAWAGSCERSGEPTLGAQETAGRRLVVVRALAQCDAGRLEQEFVLSDGTDPQRVAAFRWKKEQA